MKLVSRHELALILFFGLVLVIGCDGVKFPKQPAPPPPPQPTILVINELTEDPGSSVVRIEYYNHNYTESCRCYTTINDIEKLQHYKKQAKFLLEQLEEAEKRMQIQEQTPAPSLKETEK